MKKLILPILFAGLTSVTTIAQTQSKTISFEESEGYLLGAFLGQQGWNYDGYLNPQLANIINTDATVDIQSAKIDSDEDSEGDWGFIYYNLPSATKFIISTDIKFTNETGTTIGSDFDVLSLYHVNEEGEYYYSGGYYFVYDGEAFAGDESSDFQLPDWNTDTWYNLKMDVDFETRQINYYFDNNLVLTNPIPQGITSIEEVDFALDNYGTGFIIDNFKFVDLDNLGVNEVSTNQISIFPNPTTDIIKVNAKEDVKSLEVLDFTGKSIQSNIGSNEMNVQHLSNGIYFLKVTTDKSTKVEKFIKK